MLVVHFPSWFPFEGRPYNGNFILRQIDAAGAHSTAVILHHMDEDFDPTPLSHYKNINLFPVRTAKNISKVKLVFTYLSAFKKIIRQYGKPDLLHLHVSLPLGPIAAIFSRHYRIPLIISEHWTIYDRRNRDHIPFIQKQLLKFTFNTARHITTVSNDLHKSIVETIPSVAKTPFTQVSNVVNTSVFTPAEAFYNTGIKQILHISTLNNDAKNIMGILRTVNMLLQKRNDFVLNIIHDLPNDEAADFIATHHLENHVHLLGGKDEEEVAKHLKESAFLLLFSNYENQPCVILEAFCCGKPVLTTPVGGILEVTHDQNAVIVEARNETQLLEKMDYMLDHYQHFNAQDISRDARQHFSTEAIGKLFNITYQTTLQK